MSQATITSRSSVQRTTDSPPPRKRRRTVAKRGRPLWMLIPGAVLLTVIVLIPLVMAIWMSLLDLSQYTIRQWLGAPFVALENYVVVVTQTQFFQSLAVSIGFAVIATVLSIPIGVAAAIVTHNAFRGRAVVRSLFLVPYVIPSFVVATIWRTIMQPGGVWTGLLSFFGIHSNLWLNGPNAFWTLVIVEIWASWPFIYLLTLAGLQTIEHQVFEAAALDGVTWGRQLRSIVFPNIGGPLALACVVSVLSHINNFTLPYVLFGIPAPNNVQTLPFLTYIQSFTIFRFGLGAATAVLSLVLLAIPLIVYLRMMRLDVGKEA
ncbi:carbohydrate ABC transporter permease [Humibacter ginsenosidimutans]|uniref:Sugar ABC transporter permease n=1 Tax=Humibacter ginsenosidimutans TaxID=2599293 RepID=A0A5B8M410_9MICO|nr:sugar ABC transporter permease [Humibacter ginsenosidimutans]QDZ14462.1 sugar ABC transporter permease [Humibacter ginsenosidimutans]